jgi:hypothetical protein
LSVSISGPDASEFSISKTQLGMPPTNLELTPFDSIYVDVTFKADLTRPLGYIRHAYLDAKVATDLMVTSTIWGKVDSAASIVHELPIRDMLITPNPLTGDIVNVSFSSKSDEKLIFAVYDMLGREVASVKENIYPRGENSIPIQIGNVPNGVYILRITDGALVKSMSFRVVK